MAKKTAQESLGRLRTGIARDTPASRATAGSEAASGAQQESIEKSTTESGARKQAAERKVRVSVDLPRAEHKYLRDFAYDSESDAMSVMRALLQEMTEDEALAVRVQRRLAGSR
jgi:hypothetical protein